MVKLNSIFKNWRPICLLNVIYKIASGCIANRLKLYMGKLISRDQTGFLKGRFIGENIRLVYDLMNYTERNNIPGLLMLIDFEKVFDSVSWEFVFHTLDLFNFGNSIKDWIQTFYNGIKTCIIQNGIISDYFYPQRGCRQGDPISPYLFLLCAEILGTIIRNNKDIKGIKIGDTEYKISQYADDTSLFTNGSPETLDGILRELDFFADISGLNINFSKTKMVWIGSKKFSKETFHHSIWKLDWNNTNFDLLGIKFSVNLDDMINLNYNVKLDDIKKLIKQWKLRKLTILGRLTVIKSLIIPKMNHLVLTLPNPSKDFLENFERELYVYLWGSKIHKVNKQTIIQDYRSGGLKMIDYNDFILALKSSWIRRLTHSKSIWVNLLETSLNITVNNLLLRGTDFLSRLGNIMQNCFWKEVFYSWQKIIDILALKNENIHSEHIWYNPHIRVENNSVFLKSYFNAGFIFIIDLFDAEGNFISL